MASGLDLAREQAGSSSAHVRLIASACAAAERTVWRRPAAVRRNDADTTATGTRFTRTPEIRHLWHCGSEHHRRIPGTGRPGCAL
ncbi:hypothetical protein ABIA38_003469 [Embleya sp. AB8]